MKRSGIALPKGILFLGLLFSVFPVLAQGGGMLSGRIYSADGGIVDFARVYLKGTESGGMTNEKGIYHVKARAGAYTLVVSALGYETEEKSVKLVAGERIRLNITLNPSVIGLNEVVVMSDGVSRVKQSGFNAAAVSTEELRNSTRNLSDALTQLPGIKLRESGGVGSDTQLMLDGFSGKHIKVFIDGVPQEGVGSSFGLNTIPVNFAERIEVYKGVVPVGFGTDALGGVINIVTNKKRRKWFLDASYSYGSFNTHKSYVHFGQTFRNGLMYEVNAFQNYSDNDYRVDTPVEHFNADGTTSLNSRLTERVKRFHDRYHNEAVVTKVGLTGKTFADWLVIGFTYSNFHKEIQTGVIQKVVFGEKFRKGHSLMPSLEYRKRDLFAKGLDVTLTANYNDNITHNVDTATYRFNWLGERKYLGGQRGEQSYQNAEFKNRNWNGTFTATYRIGEAHTFVLNQVFNAFDRTSRSDVTASISDPTISKETRKNITGLSYRIMPSGRGNYTIFGKYYNQFNAGPVSASSTGVGNYVRRTSNTSAVGYGAAGTYVLLKALQAKLSYEKAFRLPATDELFGDEDLEMGKIGLKPEKSDNFNLNLSYSPRLGKHAIYAEAGWIYRDTKDFIRRRTDTYSGNRTYASYENHGRVKTKGYNISVRYSYANRLSLGGMLTQMNVRDAEKSVAGGTEQASLTYKARIPNQPYLFAHSDVSFYCPDFLAKGNRLTVSYDNFYQHSFPLYWENLGASSTKERVPGQFSHNVTLMYSIRKGRYNVSLECRNLSDEKLYDNFSLQKAGRAFYGKVRIYFGE